MYDLNLAHSYKVCNNNKWNGLDDFEDNYVNLIVILARNITVIIPTRSIDHQTGIKYTGHR